MSGVGEDGGRWAKQVVAASLLVGVAIGLVGNLATGTVQVAGTARW
ncbi:hypothetical protein [Acrocarpospora catenulata]|nr:hypothetical protein [Acrocarpospora catenulata]